MRKDEFIAKVADKAGESKVKTRDFVSAFEEVLIETIKDNDSIQFSFGKIGGKDKKGRTYRNPQTGAAVEVGDKSGYPYAKFASNLK